MKSKVNKTKVQDLSSDKEDELTKILSEEIARSIDKEIMNSLKPYIREAKIDSILKEINKRKTKSSE